MEPGSPHGGGKNGVTVSPGPGPFVLADPRGAIEPASPSLTASDLGVGVSICIYIYLICKEGMRNPSFSIILLGYTMEQAVFPNHRTAHDAERGHE
ncbi:MAG: hypothetical protein BWY17_00580 [Deltaproteobacteria bacterium ADurb.Bin207]|jgi:hypothetical protein|nr:MAG: hypothetical protein BWY17_00580 [Deltaproteobacteria bacterium ADurb.Bin207]